MKNRGIRSFVQLLSVALVCVWCSPAGAQTIASFSMDSDPGWTTEGQWEFGQPQGIGGDPSSGYTGANVYGYNLSGQHPNNMPTYWLTTLPIDCSNYTNVVLKFRRWLGVEPSIWDHAVIQVRKDGSAWQQIWENPASTIDDASWKAMTYDISAVADGQESVYVRWGMGPTDSIITYCGWNIDDVVFAGDLMDDLSVSPTGQQVFSGYERGPFSPTNLTFDVQNAGTNTISWTVSSSELFLHLSTTGGVLTAGSIGTVQAALAAGVDSWAPGQYVETVVFRNETSAQEQLVPVSLEIVERELSDFIWDYIPTNRIASVPFDVRITAADQTGEPLSGYTNAVPIMGVSTQATATASAGLAITECHLDTPDFVEIQNVFNTSIAGSSYIVAVSDSYGNINSVNSTYWQLPDLIPPGEVLYRTDSNIDNYWGSNLYWSQGGNGWIMILNDNTGEVVDFVAWGWNASAISNMAPVVNGHVVSIGDQFSGHGVSSAGAGTIQRQGNEDQQTASDFAWISPDSMGAQNSALTLPFEGAFVPVSITPANTGPFVDGVWVGSVTVPEAVTNMMLRADDGLGHQGDSNPFTVRSLALSVVMPDAVTEGDPDVSVRVEANHLSESDLPVTLEMDNTNAIVIPEIAVIPAGQTSVTFSAQIIDDSLLDGTAQVTVTASNTNFLQGAASMYVFDNESAALSLSLPSTTYEGAGTISGALISDSPPDVDVVVDLISNNTNEIDSGSIVIPAGQTFTPLTLPVVDDHILDGLQTATVEAHVENWNSGYASVFVIDNEDAVIDVQLLAHASEGDGAITNGGMVLIPAAAVTDVDLLLTSSDTTELLVPAYVTIPAGATQALFDISVVDDAETDGSITVSVLAQAPGYIPDSGSTVIRDNDLHHLQVIGLPEDLGLYDPAYITLYARTLDGYRVTEASGSVSLTAQGDRGAVDIIPAVLSNMVEGTVAGSISFGSIGNDITMVADLSGVTGTSSVFNVTGSEIAVSPAGLTNTLVVSGATATRSMVVSNTGNADLEFDIQAIATFPNLVINGDFEAGNSGFISDYVYVPGSNDETKGIYTVADDSQTWNGNFTSTMKDHTSGGGQMLMANGDSTGNAVVWQQEIEVTAGFTYNVSAWTASLFGEFLPVLDFQVDGESLGSIAAEDLTWNEFATEWTATSSGTVVFSIVDTQFIPPFLPGNHFAIDDIVFQPVKWNEVVHNSVLDLDLGLVAHYPFDGAAGDVTTNGYDGVLIDATPIPNRFGEIDSALYFDGLNDRIVLPGEALNFDRTDSFSQSFWIKSGDNSNGRYIISKLDGDYRGMATILGNGVIQLQMISTLATGNRLRLDGTTVLSDDQWHHIAVTYDGSSLASGVNVYIDGNPESMTVHNDSLISSILNSVMPTIGSRDSAAYYNGALDEVRIYNRVLTADEVQYLLNEGQPEGTVDLESGLVADYPFNGNAADASANGYDGVPFSATLMTNRFGEADSAYYFDGLNDRIDLPGEVLNFERTDTYSKSFWIKTSDTDNANNILAKMAPPVGSRGINVVLKFGKLLVHLVNDATLNNQIRVEGSTDVNDDQWHHVVATYDGSSVASGVRLYVDGTLESMTAVFDSLTGSVLNGYTPSIGSRSSGLYYEGALDEVRIYNRVLTADEVQYLLNEGQPEGTVDLESGLAANYPFNGNADDETGNGHDGIVYGATLTADRFGNPDSAYHFNGVDNYIDIGNLGGFKTVSMWVKQAPRDGWDDYFFHSNFELFAEWCCEGELVLLDPLSLRGVTTSIKMDDQMDQWVHLVAISDGSNSKVYFNGTNVAVSVEALEPVSAGPATIGSGLGGNDFHMHGDIDDVRIYNRALSASEVEALYTGNSGESSRPFDAPWLSADPGSGIIAPGSNITVTAVFEDAGLMPGGYTNAALIITCNDLFSPSNDVPASMYVIPQAPAMDAEPETTYGSSNMISWSAVDGPVSYLVEVATDTVSAALQQSAWLSVTNHTFTALATNQMYYYRARAAVESDIGRLEGPWSGWVWSTQLPALADGDQDGIPDWWEELHFGGTGIAGASTDFDGDGHSDHDEFVAGMNPTNPASYFMINDASVPTNGPFVIYWEAVTGRVYSVHWKESLTNTFTPMATEIAYPQSSYTDEVHQAEESGFYTIEVELEDPAGEVPQAPPGGGAPPPPPLF